MNGSDRQRNDLDARQLRVFVVLQSSSRAPHPAASALAAALGDPRGESCVALS